LKPVYVIGHKNPDIDSVAAAISYKVFKQSTEKGVFIAAAAGELNDGLKKLLSYLDFDLPMQLTTVGTTVEDLHDDEQHLFISAETP